jgi:diguanylate cyclase (GGDEF)-like protein
MVPHEAQRTTTPVEVLGALLLGIQGACASLALLSARNPDGHYDYRPERWYAIEELHHLLDWTQRYRDPQEVQTRIGMAMMEGWYRDGPGFQIAPGGLDFLAFQAGSHGYRSVMRGDAALMGGFELVALDIAAGEAQVHSSTLFSRDLELGILQGGLDATDDLLFSEVTREGDRYRVRFVNEANRASLPWAADTIDDAQVWRLRKRIRRLEFEQRYGRAINLTLNAAFATLRDTAHTDALTGALTRRALLAELETEAARALRQAQPLSLLYLDVDHFKTLNDAHGHGAGDRALEGLVELLRRALRPNDRIGRIGGDEFVILLPDTDAGAALGVVERLYQLAAHEVLPLGAVSWTPAFSIGIAELQPGQDAQTLLEAADRQLLRAKGQGRGRAML